MKRILFFLCALLVAPVPVLAQVNVTHLASLSTSGNLAANGESISLTIPLNLGFGSVGIEARGTWTGTIQVECMASRLGGTFEALMLTPRASTTQVTSFTANGQWTASVNGCQAVRARATAAMTGIATITMTGSYAGGGGGGGASGAVTVTSGTITCTNCTGSGASNTEDNPHVTADPLAPAGAVRKATPVNLSSADGDYEPLQINAGRLWVDASGTTLTVGSHAVTNAGTFAVQATQAGTWDEVGINDSGNSITVDGTVTVTDGAGALNVICDSGCSGGTTYTHDAALTVGTTVGVPAVGRASAAAPTDVSADNDAVLPWLLRNGAQATVLTAAGALIGGDATNGIDVDVTRVTGTVTVAGGLANDGAAAATNRVATLPAVVQNSAPTLTDGRNAAISLTTGGAQRVMITNAAGAAQTIATDSTHDSAAGASGPQVMGGAKNTTLPTAVTDGDAVRLLTDLYGRLQPKNVCQNPDLVSSVVISTATSGNVELVALSGSTVVTVCGFNVIAGGTVGVQFISGTGTACATGETNKTGVYPLIVNSGLNSGFGAKVFAGAAGEAVCVELSAAVQIDGILTYVQQ